MFEKLYKLIFPRKAPSARIDPCFGDASALTLRACLQKGDFEQTEAILNSISDVEQLDLALGAASDWPGRPPWIEQWPSTRPNSLWAKLVRGTHSTQWAWEARSSARAVKVNEDAWPVFFERLALARDDLNGVDTAPLSQSIAHSRLIRVLMGLEFPKESLQQCFAAATQHAPNLRSAHFAYFTAICKKWGGSDAQMFAFARESAQRFSGLKYLIAAAHIEAAIGIIDATERERYFQNPAVAQEIATAFAGFQTDQQQPGQMIGANFFAMALGFSEQPTLAKQAFALTAGFIAEVPWKYWGNAERDFEKSRRNAHR